MNGSWGGNTSKIRTRIEAMNRSESPSTALPPSPRLRRTSWAPSPPLGEKDGMRGCGSWKDGVIGCRGALVPTPQLQYSISPFLNSPVRIISSNKGVHNQHQHKRHDRNDCLHHCPSLQRLRDGHVKILFHKPETAVIHVRQDHRAAPHGNHQ